MRRIAALALSATAMCTVLATTTGAANASTGGAISVGSSSFANSSSSARGFSATPLGPKHYFHDTSVSGVAVKGDWFKAKVSGKTGIWIEAKLYDTKADGKQVGMEVKVSGHDLGVLPDLKGAGTSVPLSGFLSSTATFVYRDMRGHVGLKNGQKTFFYDAISAWHKVR